MDLWIIFSPNKTDYTKKRILCFTNNSFENREYSFHFAREKPFMKRYIWSFFTNWTFFFAIALGLDSIKIPFRFENIFIYFFLKRKDFVFGGIELDANTRASRWKLLKDWTEYVFRRNVYTVFSCDAFVSTVRIACAWQASVGIRFGPVRYGSSCDAGMLHERIRSVNAAHEQIDSFVAKPHRSPLCPNQHNKGNERAIVHTEHNTTVNSEYYTRNQMNL